MPERGLRGVRAALLLLGLVALAPVAAACDGLSPGDELRMEGGGRCTLGWLFADPTGLYFSTAGHCLGEGTRVSNPALGIEWGTGAFSFDEDAPGKDFALIRVDPEHYDKLNPRLCDWGGPTGIYRDNPSGGDVYHSGYGDVLGQNPVTRARPGYNLYWDGGIAFYWTGLGVTGDSGSAVVHEDGRAIGILTHLVVRPPDNNAGTHLDEGIRLAAEKGYQLRLVLEGEDPVAVLREVQAAPAPFPAEEVEPPSDQSPPAESSAENESEPAAGSAPPPQAEGEEPNVDGEEPLDAQQDGTAPAASAGKGAPGFAVPLLVLGVLAAVAVRQRRR